MRRDSRPLLDEDNFQVILDTFDDSRNGYMFVTTPLGAKLEQQISEEGEGNTRAGLANLNVNRNWDGVWDVAARITDDGWTAEIAIPLITVRFADAAEQTWGVNFMRNIRHKNEQVFWAPIPKAYSLTRVSMAGAVVGLQGLSHGMDLKLKPYVVGGVRDTQGSANLTTTSFLRDRRRRHEVRRHRRAEPRSHLQHRLRAGGGRRAAGEPHAVQPVLPREARLLLENAGLFKMGTGGTFTSTTVETDLFFSRRIGLSDTGQPIPIIGGARLAASRAATTSASSTSRPTACSTGPATIFSSALQQRHLKRSRVGAIFINKETTGGDAITTAR
jgi:hypothetical protein